MSSQVRFIFNHSLMFSKPLLFFGGFGLLLCGVLLAANSRNYVSIAIGILMCAVAAFGPLLFEYQH